MHSKGTCGWAGPGHPGRARPSRALRPGRAGPGGPVRPATPEPVQSGPGRLSRSARCPSLPGPVESLPLSLSESLSLAPRPPSHTLSHVPGRIEPPGPALPDRTALEGAGSTGPGPMSRMDGPLPLSCRRRVRERDRGGPVARPGPARSSRRQACWRRGPARPGQRRTPTGRAGPGRDATWVAIRVRPLSDAREKSGGGGGGGGGAVRG